VCRKGGGVSPTADGLRLAVGTLTAVRIRPPQNVNRAAARAAMLLAPVAVLPLGLAAALVGALHPWLGLPPPVTAALAIGAVALGTRGLHLDGLADTADGLGSGHDRNRALDVMRRGNTGPMGVSAVVLVLLTQVAAAASVLARPWGPVALGVLVCLARSALWLGCAAGVPAARPAGLGATVAGVVPRWAVVLGLPAVAAAATLVLMPTGSPWWTGMLAVGSAGLVVAALVTRCLRRFGGITGDVLGAAVEVNLLVLLVVASL
jgi:adenosylcobinamide-GDP ribazoletransferase